MSERDELIAGLRAMARYEHSDVTQAADAADLLERDGGEIERLGRELAEAREERYPPIPPNGSAARSLGAYLADVLCEDQWARAEEMLLGIHAAYVALCAENEALRTDVERYRWLRDCCSEDAVIQMQDWNEDGATETYYGLRGAALDAAIDAAKERTP